MSITKEFIEALEKIVGGRNVHVEEPMKDHISFRVGGPADVLVTPTIEELKEVLALAKEKKVPVTIIGNGSNLLVGDLGIRGLVVELGNNASEVKLVQYKEKNILEVEAGCILSKAARFAYENELGGMEFAAGIPGTLGGAVVMNAGAYGGEMKDILVSARVLTEDLEIKEISLEELDLSYRHSCVIEKGYTVLSAKLQLEKKDKAEIKAMMDDFRERRVSKQPLEYPSAGSTFKRPEGYFAGKLVEDAGLRGYQVGGAQVSEKHCGFVINKDNATAEDIKNLMQDVAQIVKDKFGVTLEAEVKFLGEFK